MRPSLERHRYLLDFTLTSLLRRRRKTLTLLAVYALVIFAVASVLFLTSALREQARLVLRGSPDLVVQRMAAGRHDLVPEGYLRTLGSLRGVRGVRGRLWGYYFDPVSGATLTVMVGDAGSGAAPGDAVLGPGVARVRYVAAGERFPMNTYDGGVLDLRIATLAPASVDLVASDLVLVSEGDFRALFGMQPGSFTDVAMEVPNPQEVGTVARKVTQYFPDVRVITRADMLRTYDAIFDWRSGLTVVVLLGAVLALAIVAWDRAAGLSAEEQHEIGVLKAIGWETSDVLWLKFWEGTVISLTSFLAGILLAYVHVFLTPVILFEPVLKGWSVLYPEFRLVPEISPYQVATLFFLTVVPYTVATIIPSWRAATIDPDAVMRS